MYIVNLTGSTLDLNGSGNPPCGIPMYPCRNSTTDRGNDSSSALSSTSALVRLFCTMNWAKSPTIFEDGVTWERRLQQLWAKLCSTNAKEKKRKGGWRANISSVQSSVKHFLFHHRLSAQYLYGLMSQTCRIRRKVISLWCVTNDLLISKSHTKIILLFSMVQFCF